MHQRIALVEDEQSLILTLTDRLEAEGYDVTVFENGQDAFESIPKGDFDLVVLDVMLPGKNGLDICRDLRLQEVVIPILMLTARRDTVDKVLGLKLGADDYLTKPFEMIELVARVEALLRRNGRMAQGQQDSFCFGDISVDFSNSKVLKAGEEVPISALEFKLLRYLVENRNRVLTRNELLDAVWGYDQDVYTRTVDVHILNLRHKLEPVPERPIYIQTLHGRGYRFSLSESALKNR